MRFEYFESDADNFWARVDRSGECWVWLLTPNRDGYGTYTRRGKIGMAHRYAYELEHGPIPDGLQVDHVCRNRLCVRPDPRHLELVTQRENTRRGVISRKIEPPKPLDPLCGRGHEYTPENTELRKNGRRECRQCRKIARIARYHLKKEAAV